MKVKDIVRDHEWHPGSFYGRKPEVSVLLPTFRRAKDGLFAKVVQNILRQSLNDLELVIVDDGATDGTAGIIADFMAEDGRVSCIRHPKNVGLPAISEFEAYTRARADFISFAFDDFVFEADALEKLLDYMRSHRSAAAHGQALMHADGADIQLGTVGITIDRLLYENHVANGSVCLAREVIETVGLYDPHVLVSRSCDWDLWRRVARRYSFSTAPVLMGREHGASRADSLGNTYPMRFEVMQEFLGENRDALLLPETFAERDVLAVPNEPSYALHASFQEVKSFFENKFWFPRSIPARTWSDAAPSKPAIAILGYLTASELLCWRGEPGSDIDHATFIDPNGPASYIITSLMRADLVIICREIFRGGHQTALEACRLLGIPHIYYVDDNFVALSGEYEELKDYTADALRAELSSFEMVVVTSNELKSAFQNIAIHPKIRSINPIYSASLFERLSRSDRPRVSGSDSFDVAFFGGLFRTQSLKRCVIPALGRLSERTRLMTRPMHLDVESSNIEHVVLPLSECFEQFLESWRSTQPSVVVHPPGQTVNIKSKTANTMLVSWYIGAVPIVTDEPAYADFGLDQGVEKINDDIESWEGALRRLQDRSYRARMLDRLGKSCVANFTSSDRDDIVRHALESRSLIGAATLEHRYRKTIQELRKLEDNARETKDRTVAELVVELKKVHRDCKALIEFRDKAQADIAELASELHKVHADCAMLIKERAELQGQLAARHVSN